MTDAPPTPLEHVEVAAGKVRARRLRADPFDLLERFGILVVWGAVVLVFSLLKPSTFPTTANFQTIFGTQAVLLVMTLGLLIALTAGEFDLSIGSVMGFGAILVAWLNVVHHWSIGTAVLATLAFGVLFGAVNAFLVIRVGVPSLVATLGTGTLLGGVGFGISNSVTIGGISQHLVDGASRQMFGLPVTFYVGVGIVVLVWYGFEYTPIGRYLLFVGEGREVARLAGLRVDAMRGGALIACSLVATLAGLMQAGTVGAADPGGGGSFLLPAFAGAFLGQTAIKPGRFNAWGTFVAVYFLVTGITGLQLLGYVGWVQDVFYGGSLVLAVTLARLAARRRAVQS
ncbi:MAG TPA: ABC transporter permease [Gaiellaceae bacterium]|nr:ABC transporter permease [Gaiellaceae bacterium]